ncbi:MAG: phosphodiester glycosidase family protein [Deltaproteobacteria bacterium]|nr:phosphodiester glycosidase family protein [Deltaproteobacteria bacterium]
MILRILAVMMCWWICLGALPAAGEGWRHTPPAWRELGRGLSFAEVKVLLDEREVERLAVVKIDPAANAFRVFHGKPQSLIDWQQESQAPVVFNAGYYAPGGKPVGLILMDGKTLGPLRNPRMRGMFVAEPKGMSPDLPRATILDLVNSPLTPQKLPWTQGVQSFPLLLDYKGRIRVSPSEKVSHRTVVATDRQGNILVFNTADAYFTLYNLAQFLKASAFEIDSALNLDGGRESQLFIKTKDFSFFSPSDWESRLGSLLDRKQFLLPTVIGVFPRQE